MRVGVGGQRDASDDLYYVKSPGTHFTIALFGFGPVRMGNENFRIRSPDHPARS
jgi:hypothetical protein